MNGPTFEETLDFIKMAHGEQTRWCDHIPYFTHPMMVAGIASTIADMFNIPDDLLEKIQRTALLHDTIEDTDVTIEMLGNMGYPISILNSVNLLTRVDETHNESVDKIIASGDLVAMIVKAADAYHNSAFSEEEAIAARTKNVDPEGMHKRYLKSHEKLIKALVSDQRIKDYINPPVDYEKETERLLDLSNVWQQQIDDNPYLKQFAEKMIKGMTIHKL